jgi:hypothetical protein
MKFSREIEQGKLRVLGEALAHGAMIRFFSGAAPPSCSAPDPDGYVLAEIELPDPPVKKFDGEVLETVPWTGVGGEGAGLGRLCRSFRIVDNCGEVICQGSVTEAEGNGDIKFNNPAIAAGRELTITRFRFVQDGPPE